MLDLTSTINYYSIITEIYYKQSMYDPTLSSRQIAYKLIQKAKKITQPGTGLLVSSNQNEQIDSEFVKIVICDVQQAERFIKRGIQICLSFDKEETNSMQKFTDFYLQKLSQLLANENVSSVILEQNSQNAQNILAILRLLQSKEIYVFIKVQLAAYDFNQYQIKLSQVTKHLFQKSTIVLQGISLVIDLPLIIQSTLEQYAIMLMAVWSKIIPPSLGSLVVIDWIDSGKSKTIFTLHFLKNIELVWSLQFLTENLEHSQVLGCQCIGLN